MAAPEKLPYEQTPEKTRVIVDASVKKFFQKPEIEKKIPICAETHKFFLKMAKPVEHKSKSDYARIKSKKYLKESTIEHILRE